MDNYTIVVKISVSRDAENMEKAIRRVFEELPNDAMVLEAMSFPTRVEHKTT